MLLKGMGIAHRIGNSRRANRVGNPEVCVPAHVALPDHFYLPYIAT